VTTRVRSLITWIELPVPATREFDEKFPIYGLILS
jgi:hypothetical protein